MKPIANSHQPSAKRKARSALPVPRVRKPLGIVVPLTEEEIVALATITPEDIARAQATLEPELRALLAAKPMGKKQAVAARSEP